jgi:hypothetical protein
VADGELMDRRSFLRLLAVAPFAVKVGVLEHALPKILPFDDGIIPDSRIDFLDISRWGRTDCVALQLEHIRKQIPVLFENDKAFLGLMRAGGKTRMNSMRLPILLTEARYRIANVDPKSRIVTITQS